MGIQMSHWRCKMIGGSDFWTSCQQQTFVSSFLSLTTDSKFSSIYHLAVSMWHLNKKKPNRRKFCWKQRKDVLTSNQKKKIDVLIWIAEISVRLKKFWPVGSNWEKISRFWKGKVWLILKRRWIVDMKL